VAETLAEAADVQDCAIWRADSLFLVGALCTLPLDMSLPVHVVVVITAALRLARHRVSVDPLAIPVFKERMHELLLERALTKNTMQQFANDPGPDGFRARLERRHEQQQTKMDDSVPSTINISSSTATRWMKLVTRVRAL